MLSTDPSALRRPAATTADAAATSAAVACLACRIAGRVIAVPAAAVELVTDAVLVPLFPACPAWIAGLALDAGAGPTLVVRAHAAWRAGGGRMVLLRADGRVRWALAIDAVVALGPERDSGQPAEGWDLPAGWLRAASGGAALLVPEAVQARLDADGAPQRGAHG